MNNYSIKHQDNYLGFFIGFLDLLIIYKEKKLGLRFLTNQKSRINYLFYGGH